MTNIPYFLDDIDHTNTPKHVLVQMMAVARRVHLSVLEENLFLKDKLFGKSSEKKATLTSKLNHTVFDEAFVKPADVLNDNAMDVVPQVLDDTIAAHTQPSSPDPVKDTVKRGRKPLSSSLERVIVIHDMKEEEKRCACGCQMTHFGEDVTEQLNVVPAKIYVLQHQRLKYACSHCLEGVKIAPVCNQAVSKCLAAPGLLAHVAVMKFDHHLPLYRQAEMWKNLNIHIPSSTFSSWVIKMGDVLYPLVKQLRQEICKSDYVQADETTTQVLKTPGKKDTAQSYMWVYKTGSSVNPVIVYDYQESRHGQHAKTFLNGFQGVLQTDGFQGYNCVTEQNGITAMRCFAHVRRKFVDIAKHVKDDKKADSVACKAIACIGQLYDIEHSLKDLSRERKRKIRQDTSKPICDALQKWFMDIKPHIAPKSGLDKAVTYALHMWDDLMTYLDYGDVEIDNNAAERAIKPFVVGRKNWTFMGSPNGAKAGAVLYSLIETAKANGLNPEAYLRFVLEHKIEENNAELIETLMPWNVTLPSDYLPIDYEHVQNN